MLRKMLFSTHTQNLSSFLVFFGEKCLLGSYLNNSNTYSKEANQRRARRA